MKLTLRVSANNPFTYQTGEVETVKLRRFLASAQTSISASMLRDAVDVEDIGDVVSDILTLQLRAAVWGEDSGVIQISVPSSWWQELKRLLRDRLSLIQGWLAAKIKLDEYDDSSWPAWLRNLDHVKVNYSTTTYEVRKLHPSFIGSDEHPTVCIKMTGPFANPSRLRPNTGQRDTTAQSAPAMVSIHLAPGLSIDCLLWRWRCAGSADCIGDRFASRKCYVSRLPHTRRGQ